MSFCGRMFFQVFFENVKCVTVMVLHADCTKYCAHGARRTSLFPDDFSYITWGNAEPQDGTFVALYSFHNDSVGVIHQSLRDLGD